MILHTFRVLPSVTRKLTVVAVVMTLLISSASAQVLVGDVFVDGFPPFTDTFTGIPQAGDPPSWGTLLTDSLTGDHDLVEDSDGRAGDGPAANDGMYTPFLLVNTADVTPITYNLSSTMTSFDNDGLGLVFGYQDNDNYFRVGFREQSSGSLGFSVGTSVQKVVGGVITQLGWDNTATPPVGTPFDVDVFVDGPAGNDWSVSMNNQQILSGNDADLQPGNYGVLSWGQASGGGTTVQKLAVSSLTLNQAHDFSAALSPVPWRSLTMTNMDGVSFAPAGGSFHQAFANGTIEEGTNGFINATAAAPNTDYIGPAVVIDEADSETWTNYEMKVRMNTFDNDTLGVLVRVADDDTFYRIGFTNQAENAERPVQGMGIQKNNGGVWSELFGDNSFVYTEGVPFDVSVQVVGNSITVQVIDDPDGAANVINYAPVIDGSDPILAGTVGFAVWGSDASIYSPYGGDGDVLLRTIIPEPSTLALLGIFGLFVPARYRRK